jgi:hypothetical protein
MPNIMLSVISSFIYSRRLYLIFFLCNLGVKKPVITKPTNKPGVTSAKQVPNNIKPQVPAPTTKTSV